MAKKATLGKKLIEDYFTYLKKGYREAPQRAREVLEPVNALEARGFALKEHKDVIRREFIGSVQRYLFGFYEDAIYHSCFAVEFALLHLLDENLEELRKKEIHDGMNRSKSEEMVKKDYVNAVINRLAKDGVVSPEKESEAKRTLFEEFKNQEVRIRTSVAFGFRQIIRECRRKGLIDKTTYKLANKMNAIRDTHLHPQNFTSALSLQYKKFLEVPKFIQNAFFRFIPGGEVVVTMPDYSWASRDSVRKDIEKEVENIFSDIHASLRRLKVSRLREFLVPHFYFRERARESLKLSFEILTKIGFY